MGWCFTQGYDLPSFRDKKIKENLEGFTHTNGHRVHALSCRSKGWRGLGRVWSLYVVEDKDGKVFDSFICVDLLDSYMRDGEVWSGYKDVDLSMGPNQTDCPVQMVKDYAELPKQHVGENERNWLADFAKNHPKSREAVKAILSHQLIEG